MLISVIIQDGTLVRLIFTSNDGHVCMNKYSSNPRYEVLATALLPPFSTSITQHSDALCSRTRFKMIYSLVSLFALAASSSLVAADDVYSFIGGECSGNAYFFQDVSPQVCLVGISRANTNISTAIAEDLTFVRSGLFVNTNTTVDKLFFAWTEGPDSNSDGPLQCGSIAAQKKFNSRRGAPCIKAHNGQNFTAFSWVYSPEDNDSNSGDSSSHYKRREEYKKRLAAKTDSTRCTSTKHPDGCVIDGKMYSFQDASLADIQKLKALVANGNPVPDDLQKHAM